MYCMEFSIHANERGSSLAAMGFKRVMTMRAFEAVIAQIQAAIQDGTIRHGERLASERDLVQEFGVSRATLREALRGLEALGWIEIRTGAQGGIFAVRPSADRAGSALEALMRFHEVTPSDLEEFRTSFEPETAAWAATRATDDAISTLRGLVTSVRQAVSSPETAWSLVSDLDLEFHMKVAEASGNRVRTAVMFAVHSTVQSASRSLDPIMTDRVRLSIADELHVIVEAIAARDSAAARDAMRRHVERFSRMETEWLERGGRSTKSDKG